MIVSGGKGRCFGIWFARREGEGLEGEGVRKGENEAKMGLVQIIITVAMLLALLEENMLLTIISRWWAGTDGGFLIG